MRVGRPPNSPKRPKQHTVRQTSKHYRYRITVFFTLYCGYCFNCDAVLFITFDSIKKQPKSIEKKKLIKTKLSSRSSCSKRDSLRQSERAIISVKVAFWKLETVPVYRPVEITMTHKRSCFFFYFTVKCEM